MMKPISDMTRALTVSTLLIMGFTWTSHINAQSFYSCIDKYGRKLGSDRPIPECADTIQKEHNAAGVVIRQRDGSNPSKAENSSQASQPNTTDNALDERREKALLARYRNQDLHQQERQKVIALIDNNIARTQKQINELLVVKAQLEKEINNKTATQNHSSATIQRKLADNDQTLKILKTMLADANSEKERAHQRFDEEQAILLKLWNTTGKK